MPELDDHSLETLLREHLSAELDGQAGRCVAAFLRRAGAASSTVTATDGAAPRLRLTAPPEASSRFNRFGWRLNGWFIGLAGAALAASIAALWAAPAAFRGGVPVVPVRSVRPADPDRSNAVVASAGAPGADAPYDVAEWNPPEFSPPASARQPALHWVQSRTWDEGTVVLDDPEHDPDRLVPARKIRQQQWEHTQWYDPSHRASVEMTVPRQNVKLVEMDTY